MARSKPWLHRQCPLPTPACHGPGLHSPLGDACTGSLSGIKEQVPPPLRLFTFHIKQEVLLPGDPPACGSADIEGEAENLCPKLRWDEVGPACSERPPVSLWPRHSAPAPTQPSPGLWREPAAMPPGDGSAPLRSWKACSSYPAVAQLQLVGEGNHGCSSHLDPENSLPWQTCQARESGRERVWGAMCPGSSQEETLTMVALSPREESWRRGRGPGLSSPCPQCALPGRH